MDGEWNFACAFANWAFFNVSHYARSRNFWKKFHNNGNARISWTVMLKSTFTLAMPIKLYLYVLTNFVLIGITLAKLISRRFRKGRSPRWILIRFVWSLTFEQCVIRSGSSFALSWWYNCHTVIVIFYLNELYKLRSRWNILMYSCNHFM